MSGINFLSCVPSTVVCKMAFKSTSKLFVTVLWGNKHGNSNRHRRPLASGGKVAQSCCVGVANTADVCVRTDSKGTQTSTSSTSLLLCSSRRCLQNGIQVKIKAIYDDHLGPCRQCCRRRQRRRQQLPALLAARVLATLMIWLEGVCCICVPRAKFSFACISSCMACEKPCNVISSLVFLPPLFAKWHPSQDQGYL